MPLTLSTKISPVVRFISNLLFAVLSGSMPWPVRKYTIFIGLSTSPSVAVTCERESETEESRVSEVYKVHYNELLLLLLLRGEVESGSWSWSWLTVKPLLAGPYLQYSVYKSNMQMRKKPLNAQ